MVINFVFANITILSCFFSFFFTDFSCLVPAVAANIFIPAAELVILIGLPTKEGKQKIENIHKSKLYAPFCASYSFHFGLFLQRDNFLFYLIFNPAS